MPTYEYTCQKCGHAFESVHSMTAKPLSVCPKELCPKKPWGKGSVKKQMSAGAGLLFKGTGFYITDYRSKNYTEGAKKEAPPAKTEAKPSTTPPAADSKPKAKTEKKA
ncbi:MAG: zinc ribbon domain-containing protein [Verrucomicrobia bacterium]|nr:zinc ribbon domain-containing protein [Verrucomicrobiota bacterium]